MASRYSTNEVLQLVLDDPVDESESEDDFDGYVSNDNLSVISQQHDYEGVYRRDANDSNNIDDDSEDEDADENDVQMSDEFLSLPEFSGLSSCSKDMSNKNPIDFFELLFTQDIGDNIVAQTNLYADQYLQEKENDLPPKSRLRFWRKKLHTITEFMQFLSVMIVMGIINFPKIEDHWVTTWPYCNDTCSRIMTRDRFSLIMKFLHVNDNKKIIKKGNPGYDPIFKIRPLYENLISNFKLAYNLGREVSIDESMIGFKGRLYFIQYMAKKPTKWGMKAFVLADANTGYTYNWRLYAGI